MGLEEEPHPPEGTPSSPQEDRSSSHRLRVRSIEEDVERGVGAKSIPYHQGYKHHDLGLLKLKVKLRGEKSIYSLLELSKIKQGRLGEHFLKKTWEDLADRAYWKQPHNPKNL